MRMKKTILIVLAISFFSCKNTSEKTEVVEVTETSVTEFIEENVSESEELENTSEEKKENKTEIETSLLFPFDKDLSTFIKEPFKQGINQGDCSDSYQKYTKNDMEVSKGTFDCDIWGFTTYSFLLNKGEIIHASFKSAKGIEGYNEKAGFKIDNATYFFTEKVYDFSTQPNMQYIRSDTLKDFETKVLQTDFLKSEIKDGKSVYAEIMAKYSEHQNIISEQDGPLILTENSLGSLPLNNEKILDVYELRETFDGIEVSDKTQGESSDSYFNYYKIGEHISMSTANTENDNLDQVRIEGVSTIPDIYGAKIGMAYNELIEKRPNLVLSTAHYHVFLTEEGSKIKYKMSLGDYQGPDKDNYTLEDIPNAKVITIIWE